jgi:uncharacterized protein (TIGR02996 family)
MSSEVSFLQAIHDTPDDDTLRLVFADWLDDHGDRRADLVRLSMGRAAARDLSQQETELKKRDAALWLGRLATRVQEWDVRRGLLRVEGEAHRLENVLVRKDICPVLRWVEELKLTGTAEELCRVLACPHIHDIPGLSLECPPLGLTIFDVAEIVPALESFARLCSLTLAGQHLVGLAATELAESAHLGRLSRLVLSHNDLSDEGAEHLAKGRHLDQLHCLFLDRNAIGPDGAEMLLTSPRRAGLRRLNLNDNALGDEGAWSIAGAERWPALTHLSLGSNDIEPDGISALVWSPHVARLEELDLSGNAVLNQGAIDLASSPHLCGLRRLNLDSTGIIDRGARALAESEYLSNLEYLSLEGNNIDDPAVLYKSFGDRVVL